jgi:hypothetical protein
VAALSRAAQPRRERALERHDAARLLDARADALVVDDEHRRDHPHAESFDEIGPLGGIDAANRERPVVAAML